LEEDIWLHLEEDIWLYFSLTNDTQCTSNFLFRPAKVFHFGVKLVTIIGRDSFTYRRKRAKVCLEVKLQNYECKSRKN
jgi:hypothetical protein